MYLKYKKYILNFEDRHSLGAKFEAMPGQNFVWGQPKGQN